MYFKGVVAGLQGAAMLQGRYCDAVRSQLAAQEEKVKKKKSNKVVGDGLSRLLTDPQFIKVVRGHEEAPEQVAVEMEEHCLSEPAERS